MLMTPFHALYTARELLAYSPLTAAYASTDIEIYPYQVAATMFAMRSPYLKGAVLADEGSLGKTYEALLIISQLYFEGRDRILIIVPTPLLGQWIEILENCFTVPFECGFAENSVPLITYEQAVANLRRVRMITGVDYTLYSTTSIFEIIEEFNFRLKEKWSSFVVEEYENCENQYLELFFGANDKMIQRHMKKGYHLNKKGEGCFMLMGRKYESINLDIVVKEQKHGEETMLTMAFDSKLLLKNIWGHFLVLPNVVEKSPFCAFIMDTLVDILKNSIISIDSEPTL